MSYVYAEIGIALDLCNCWREDKQLEIGRLHYVTSVSGEG